MAVNPEPGSGGFAAPGQKGVGSASAQAAGTPASPNIQGQSNSPCLVSYPSASVPLVGTVGGGCLLSKTAVRAGVGGLLVGSGAVLMFLGLAVLAATGFKRSGLADKAAGVASVLPGGAVVAPVLRGSTSGTIRAHRAEGASRERAEMRRLGEPRMNPNLREGRGAIRETPAGTRRRRAERDRPPF